MLWQCPPRLHPDHNLPTPSLSLRSLTQSLPRSCAWLRCGVSWTDWGVSPFVLRRIARLQTPVHGSLHPDCWQASLCALLESRLWQPFYLSGEGGLNPLHRTPWLGCPGCGMSCWLPRTRICLCRPSLHRDPSQGCSFDLVTFFPSILPSYMEIFLSVFIA